MIDEGLLHRMEFSVLGQAFDGRDIRAILHDGQGQARQYPPAVDQHRTGTALTLIAALLAFRSDRDARAAHRAASSAGSSVSA